MSDIAALGKQTFRMDPATLAQRELDVNAINKELNGNRVKSQQLGKDDFLKILMTQLTHQDPTKPMEDREFISQMAQFSSLEQMTNMAKGFTDLSSMLSSGQAMNSLGQTVEIQMGERVVRGRVDGVTTGQYPQVLVEGNYYDFANVKSITAVNSLEE